MKPRYQDAGRATPTSKQLRVMLTPAMSRDIDRYANAWDVSRSSAAMRPVADGLKDAASCHVSGNTATKGVDNSEKDLICRLQTKSEPEGANV